MQHYIENNMRGYKFDRDFSHIGKTLQDRVVEGLRELNDNPYAGRQLKGKLKNLWSWRVGEYRILYQNFLYSRKTSVTVTLISFLFWLSKPRHAYNMLEVERQGCELIKYHLLCVADSVVDTPLLRVFRPVL